MLLQELPVVGHLGWLVPTAPGGFTLGSIGPGGELVIVPVAGTERQRYAVFEEAPVLFRTFIEAAATPDGYLAFANTYGALTISEPPGPPHERILFWRGAQAWFRHLTSIADLVHAGDEVALEKMIERVPGNLRFCATGGPIAIEPDGLGVVSVDFSWLCGQGPDAGQIVPALNAVSLAQMYLGAQLNHAMHKRTRVVAASLGLYGHKAEVGLVPTNLLSAMVVQLFLTVIGNRVQHKCIVCGKWFEIGPGAGRLDKVICSSACRMRSSRQRRAKKGGDS